MSLVHQVDTALRDIERSSGAIVVGPWLSEIGFELLYWIPFLRWCVEEGRLDPSRVQVLSRGGCRSWYQWLSPVYHELFDQYSPTQLRSLNEERIRDQSQHGAEIGIRKTLRSAKQLRRGPVDNAILDRFGLMQATICHPSLMYRLFQSFWRRFAPELYQQRTRSRRLMPPAKPADLPDRYIAVKFYASSACPIRAHHQDVIDQMVRLLAGQIDVVVLHPTTRFDDHAVFAMPKHPRVHHRIFTPATNLDEQTAIIGGAAAFVGTYGGFAYLAPFLGVRTLSFYGIANFRRDHLAVMRTVSAQVLRTPFEAIPLNSGLQTVRTLLTGRSYAAA